jgi:hypothetical protein
MIKLGTEMGMTISSVKKTPPTITLTMTAGNPDPSTQRMMNPSSDDLQRQPVLTLSPSLSRVQIAMPTFSVIQVKRPNQ